MRVWILHQAIQSDASPDEQDVLQQVDAVGQALIRLGPGLARVWRVPGLEGATRRFVLLEDLVRAFLPRLLPGQKVTEAVVFRMTRNADVPVASLSVQSTTLDDVFVHYTGRQLRDALQTPAAQSITHVYERK